ncbi:uracil-DNA glycosylase [Sphingomonas sp. SUN019]|uniref:uracil-DNA glycosylase family protein n=1 Tax=Sphingomonas sp. SUN019 TaxID=2937788 RepID=UPI0021648DA0|nr:uracil-DNA glycosylase family protein [Sphingomonas sp. SUN019]UVO49425.1 uracil-DNA glycosylase [Sphingomonas sp. SUN019]
MGADQNIDWAKTAASALEWWRDAGVDMLVEDAPRDWLAAIPEAAAPVAVAPAATRSAAPPATIEAFLAWRMSADAPEADWSGVKIAASGPVDAVLMVLVDCPEREDSDVLMSGAVGRLFDRMLAAIGRSRADIHLAALCAARPVAGRMPREIEARLGEIARHHVALVAPKRLLVMGNAASRAILPTDAAQSRENLPVLNHTGGKVTAVVTSYHPRFLLEKPAAKAEAWRDLQMLIGGMK